ncbi:hypothetical protein [Paenibacillus arenilitoris]|uniref:Uncharacterized protein n=1 Tax=Paenibacillus arenilitoris TaxID=2772299 RepID=A0A927CT03_9BACL|nr:hypothetical protein [Paenibacillus arenilitoris]MBD2872895.1 hypothetical protein [Paenibacillus arenilitoris]
MAALHLYGTVRAAAPLVAWFDVAATAVVLLAAGTLLGVMFLFVRIASDDSDRYKELKEVVETLFGTPAHLRRNPDDRPDSATARSEAAASSGVAPFSEPCPACGETVTERHPECPSCGLRLL